MQEFESVYYIELDTSIAIYCCGKQFLAELKCVCVCMLACVCVCVCVYVFDFCVCWLTTGRAATSPFDAVCKESQGAVWVEELFIVICRHYYIRVKGNIKKYIYKRKRITKKQF